MRSHDTDVLPPEPLCGNCGRPKREHQVDLQSSGGEYVSGVVYICPRAVYRISVPPPEKKP